MWRKLSIQIRCDDKKNLPSEKRTLLKKEKSFPSSKNVFSNQSCKYTNKNNIEGAWISFQYKKKCTIQSI